MPCGTVERSTGIQVDPDAQLGPYRRNAFSAAAALNHPNNFNSLRAAFNG